VSDVVIRVDQLGKRYRIGRRETRADSFQEVLRDTIRSPFRYLLTMSRPPTESETLWSLRDVSFEVRRGEVLGVIGQNGSGKSTLLKILSRITEPTTGRAVINGRVGSLLEVGTGFHPELTGRENIYLNGAILGMKRREIDRKFDEIIEFAEIGKLIDTPVKRYSSGMYVRLGFSVAAHLEPEILVVDEVLAVGDAAFQRRSLGRMNKLANSGRTVLFVSHSMASIQSLCQRVILLNGGRIVAMGDTGQIVDGYLKSTRAPDLDPCIDLANHPNRITEPARAIFRKMSLKDAAGRTTSVFQMGEPITFEIELDTGDRLLQDPLVFIGIDRHSVRVCNLTTSFMVNHSFRLQGPMTVRCVWNQDWLTPGEYDLGQLSIKAYIGADRLDQIQPISQFVIVDRDVYGTGEHKHDTAVLIPNGHWEFEARPLQPADEIAGGSPTVAIAPPAVST
jgi:lipopolysaccharide transport system ATP-binding protein